MSRAPHACPPPDRKLSGEVITIATALVAVTGTAAYAIMRFSYQQFYNEFGLTPDDVGPSSAGALTQSGVGVMEFLAVFAVLPLALALLASFACRRAFHGHTAKTLVAVLALALSVVAALGVFQLFVSLTSGRIEKLELSLLAIGVLAISVKQHSDSDVPAHKPPFDDVLALLFDAGRRLPSVRWIVASLMVVIGVLILGRSLPADATSTAQCIKQHPGKPVRFVHTHRTFPWFEYAAILRVRADPARIIWIGSPPPDFPPRGTPFIYLGESGSRAFMYQPGARRTLQVPEPDIVLITRPGEKHCHWWTDLAHPDK